MSKPRIVFFGSGPVAAKSLRMLADYTDIVAVVTKPKPPHHKGDFPVLSVAEELSITTHLVSSKKELSHLISTKPFQTNVAVLIDFGIIVGQDTIDYFPKGIINSHFSLLPQWRGADPITFSILSGQSKTGVTLMLIDQGMDTGKIIRQKSLPIEANDTAISLTEKLINLSNRLLKADLLPYVNGKIIPRNQPHPDRATYSRKITKNDGALDFSKPAIVLEREIRAFLEWPKSRTQLAGVDVIITSAHVQYTPVVDAAIGSVTIIKEVGSLMIVTSDGYLCIDKLKPAGKQEMTAQAFISGYGQKFTN